MELGFYSITNQPAHYDFSIRTPLAAPFSHSLSSLKNLELSNFSAKEGEQAEKLNVMDGSFNVFKSSSRLEIFCEER
ncbi:hypothetical protein C5167_016069 [Papaver somniferum]|nr:hypothetical protein C5167_016069 [Papaver somniferum]